MNSKNITEKYALIYDWSESCREDRICRTDTFWLCYEYEEQEAQLPQRDSASATHVFLGSLTDRALH